jgi:hypothetical protein
MGSNYRTIIHRDDIAKIIFKMDLPSDRKGYVPFGVVLHAAIRNAYGKKFVTELDKETYKIIRGVELKCIADIVIRHNKETNKEYGVPENEAASDRYTSSNRVNPFWNIFTIKMSFKCWTELALDWDRFKMQCQIQGVECTTELFLNDVISDEESDEEITEGTGTPVPSAPGPGPEVITFWFKK